MVKEILELEDEIREIEVKKTDLDKASWGEQNFVSEEVGDEETGENENDSTIGDVMLGREEERDSWKSKTLEDKTFVEEEDWDDEEVEEDFGFSYEEVGKRDGLYGAVGSSDLYNTVGGNKGKDLYSSGTSVSGVYEVGSVGQTPGVYFVGGKKDKKSERELYKVSGVGEKKKKRGSKSGLESLDSGKKVRGVSMY